MSEEEAARAKKRSGHSQGAVGTCKPEQEHETRAGAIEIGRAAIDECAQAEEARWQKKEKLEAAPRRAETRSYATRDAGLKE